METVRSSLLELLKERSYRKGEFKLSSGNKSEHYVNCKPVTLSGKGLALVSPLLYEWVEEDSVAVAGLTLGADPLVTGVALIAWMCEERVLDSLIIRKEPKGHGTGAWIEGPVLPEGSKIVVLEDVITTGGSSIKAATRLRDAGYEVNQIVTIVDRQVNNEANDFMESVDLELISLYKLQDIADASDE